MKLRVPSSKPIILVLGGTSEAKSMALQLMGCRLPVIYSIAGKARIPELPCEIISGGFSKRGGLVKFIRHRSISAIADLTHPYAENISRVAAESARTAGILYWRYEREEWHPTEHDRWYLFSEWLDLVAALQHKRSVFFAVGQLVSTSASTLARYRQQGQYQLIRTAMGIGLDEQHLNEVHLTWVKAIGPFRKKDEIQLMEHHQTEVLVCKNSGGLSSFAKLEAARELGIPVYMLDRPKAVHATALFSDLTTMFQCITSTLLR